MILNGTRTTRIGLMVTDKIKVKSVNTRLICIVRVQLFIFC